MGFMKAYIFGLTLAFAVGPMALLIVQRSITKGLKSAMVTSLGIALADWTFGLIAFSIGASVLLFMEQYEMYVHIFSGLILLGLALHIFLSALKAYREHHLPKAAKAQGNDFVSAYALTIHNPLTVAIYLGFLGHVTALRSAFDVFLYATVVFLGSYTGQLVIGFTASSMQRFFKDPKAIFSLNAISALGIAAFGIASFVKMM